MNDYRHAMFYSSGNGTVNCALCPHMCKIPENSKGFCGVRKNIGGKLYAESYGRVSAVALDPVEKKPLYMFHPKKYVLSAGSFGCNFRCPFCQNCDISTEYGERWQNGEYVSPEHLVKLAEKTVPDGNIGVAYTYNEPFIGYEFVYDCSKLARNAGLANIAVTNGYINHEPLEEILPFIDAMNIDLKGFSDGFYKKIKGGFETVKETVGLSRKRCHVEITTLIIPGENDSEEEITELAKWLASLNPEIPLHLTRFFPRYKYSGRQPTPRETILKLAGTAGKYLKNVFAGNMV
jgi:pyruvate formate lyase activating enzyme